MQDYSKNAAVQLVRVLGKIIKKHRLEQKKSIYKISAECSVHKDSLRLIENGSVNDIKLSSLYKIAEGLGMEPTDLLMEAKELLGKDFNVSGLN